MDSHVNSDTQLAYYNTSSASTMPKHMVSSQAVNKDAPRSVRRMRNEMGTHPLRNQPCQTDICTKTLVSTGVNYEQSQTPHPAQSDQSQRRSIPSYPYCNPLPPCRPPMPRPCMMRPPSCYPPQPESCPFSYMPYPQWCRPGSSRPDSGCWYRVPVYPPYPPFCPEASQQPNNQPLSLDDQHHKIHDHRGKPQQSRRQFSLEQYNSDKLECSMGASNEGIGSKYSADGGFGSSDDENLDNLMCDHCRMREEYDANDEELLWQEQLNAQRHYCPPPPPPSCYPPMMSSHYPPMPRQYPKPQQRPPKKAQGGNKDFKDQECDNCKDKVQSFKLLDCAQCKAKIQNGSGAECKHCKAKIQSFKAVNCDHCKAKIQSARGSECGHCRLKPPTTTEDNRQPTKKSNNRKNKGG